MEKKNENAKGNILNEGGGTMYNIAICDDDKGFIEFVKEVIRELNLSNEVKVHEYLSGEEFIFDIDNRYDLDLIILDIQMKEIDGNQVSVELRKRYKNTTLVFCSGIYKPSPENIKVAPFRFLLKEYSKSKMLQEFKEIFEHIKTKKEEQVLVCYDERHHLQIKPHEIVYVCIARRGTKVHTYSEKDTEEKVYSCKHNIEEIYEVLNEYHFVYAHNSYIVNLKHIKKQNKDEIQMVTGEILSVSRARSKELREKLTLYFERKYR